MSEPAGNIGGTTDGRRSRSSWLLILAGAGVFLAAADQTCVASVLPDMVEDVGLPQDQFFRAAWIVNGYILGYIVAMPLMGRVSDAFGHGRIFAAMLLLFAAASIWVALAGSITTLSLARTVQAIGGGAVVPISLAIVTRHVAPERRAVGLGIMAAASEAGALVGPLWGGVVADLIGWRGIFWINLPLCLPLAIAIWRLSVNEPIVARRAIDFPGAALIGGALVALTIALTDDPIEPRSAVITALLMLASVALFAAFIVRQRSAPEPLIELSRFRDRGLSAAFAMNALVGGALIVALINVPLFTNTILNDSALQGGLNLMRFTVALAAGAVLGGIVLNRLGVTRTAVAGLVLGATGFAAMTQWSTEPSFVEFSAPLFVAGFGLGLVIAPLNVAVFNAVEEAERATFASLLTVMRLLGALVGVALLTTRGLSGFYAEAGLIPLDDPRFVERVNDLQLGTYHETFIATAIVCLIALVPALMLNRGRPSNDKTPAP